MSDPEQARMLELLQLVESNKANEAEKEELTYFYKEELLVFKEENPEYLQTLLEEAKRSTKGGESMVRVQQDKALKKKEKHPIVQMERSFGLGMVAGGFLFSLHWVAIIGLSVLLWSFLRMRISTYKDDPYKDIEL